MLDQNHLFVPIDPDNMFIVGSYRKDTPQKDWEAQQQDLEELADICVENRHGGFPYWWEKDDAYCAAELVTEAYPGTSVYVSQAFDGGWICD
jgi:hypothetical protein